MDGARRATGGAKVVVPGVPGTPGRRPGDPDDPAERGRMDGYDAGRREGQRWKIRR